MPALVRGRARRSPLLAAFVGPSRRPPVLAQRPRPLLPRPPLLAHPFSLPHECVLPRLSPIPPALPPRLVSVLARRRRGSRSADANARGGGGEAPPPPRTPPHSYPAWTRRALQAHPLVCVPPRPRPRPPPRRRRSRRGLAGAPSWLEAAPRAAPARQPEEPRARHLPLRPLLFDRFPGRRPRDAGPGRPRERPRHAPAAPSRRGLLPRDWLGARRRGCAHARGLVYETKALGCRRAQPWARRRAVQRGSGSKPGPLVLVHPRAPRCGSGLESRARIGKHEASRGGLWAALGPLGAADVLGQRVEADPSPDDDPGRGPEHDGAPGGPGPRAHLRGGRHGSRHGSHGLVLPGPGRRAGLDERGRHHRPRLPRPRWLRTSPSSPPRGLYGLATPRPHKRMRVHIAGWGAGGVFAFAGTAAAAPREEWPRARSNASTAMRTLIRPVRGLRADTRTLCSHRSWGLSTNGGGGVGRPGPGGLAAARGIFRFRERPRQPHPFGGSAPPHPPRDPIPPPPFPSPFPSPFLSPSPSPILLSSASSHHFPLSLFVVSVPCCRVGRWRWGRWCCRLRGSA